MAVVLHTDHSLFVHPAPYAVASVAHRRRNTWLPVRCELRGATVQSVKMDGDGGEDFQLLVGFSERMPFWVPHTGRLGATRDAESRFAPSCVRNMNWTPTPYCDVGFQPDDGLRINRLLQWRRILIAHKASQSQAVHSFHRLLGLALSAFSR